MPPARVLARRISPRSTLRRARSRFHRRRHGSARHGSASQAPAGPRRRRRGTLCVVNSFQLDPEKPVAQSQPTSSRDAVRDVVPALIHYTETVLFGDVWERPGLSKRDRSLIVVATLIALGRE